MKHLTFEKYYKTYGSKTKKKLLLDFLKFKKVKSKTNKRKKEQFKKPSIFTGRKINIKKTTRQEVRKNKITIKKLSYLIKKKSTKRLILRLSLNKNIIKKLKLTPFRIYKKKNLEINPVLNMLEQVARYGSKKNTLKNLTNPNKYLNSKALNYFRKYVNRKIYTSKKLKKSSKRLIISKKISSNRYRNTQTTFLLKSLFKNTKFRNLLLYMNRVGTKTHTFTKVIKLLLNPNLVNFILNKDFINENDETFDDYVSNRIENQLTLKLVNSKMFNLGYVWEEGFELRHYYSNLLPHVDVFLENTPFLNHWINSNKVDICNYFELFNRFQNNTFMDFIKLNAFKNLSYKSYMYTTLLKTNILNETLSSSQYNIHADKTLIRKKLTIKAGLYSYFTKNYKQKKKKLKPYIVFYDYFKKKKLIINTPFTNEKMLLLTTKTPTVFNSNANLAAMSMQIAINTESEGQIGVDKTGSPIFCPTVFTLQTCLSKYMVKQLFTAYADNSNANSDAFYHYSESIGVSSNIHASNDVFQTPYLFNWNEDFSENSLYIRPSNTSGLVTKTNIEDKLIMLLKSTKYKSNEDFITDNPSNLETVDINPLVTKFKINNTSIMLKELSKYLKIQNRKFKKFKKLLGLVHVDIGNYIHKTDSIYDTSNLSEILKTDNILPDDVFKTINTLKRRLFKRIKVSKYNPSYALFLLKPFYKAWVVKRRKKLLNKLKRIRKKKKYLLFDKKKNKQRNPKFYNKIVEKESKVLVKKLTKRSKSARTKKMVKRYLNSSIVSKWVRNNEFYKNNFLIYQKISNIDKTDIVDERESDLISEYDDYVDELKSIALCSRFTDFDDDEVLSSTDYADWLVEHCSRNYTHDAIKIQIEHQKSYSLISSAGTPLQYRRSFNVESDYKNFDLAYYLLSNIFFLNKSLTNLFLFKYLTMRSSDFYNKSHYNMSLSFIKPILHTITLAHFGSRVDLFYRSNLYPTESFSYTIQRRILKCFALRKFLSPTGAWYNQMLVRFMSHCTGRRVYLKLNPHVENSLTFEDEAQCYLWENRVFGFQKILGPKIFIEESLRIILLALKYKDPTFLINWIRTMLYRMSFWKYRTLFRYLKFVIKDLFEPNFEKFGLRGFKVKLKGKISVAGNARTRTLLMRIGQTSHSKCDNKVAHSFTLVNSFTGVMGFNLWIFF